MELSSSCSQKTFEDKSKGCVNVFFSAIKENPKQDCRYEKICILLSRLNSTGASFEVNLRSRMHKKAQDKRG